MLAGRELRVRLDSVSSSAPDMHVGPRGRSSPPIGMGTAATMGRTRPKTVLPSSRVRGVTSLLVSGTVLSISIIAHGLTLGVRRSLACPVHLVRQVYVGCLSPDINKSDIEAHMNIVGPVRTVTIVGNNSRSKGSAVVEYESMTSASKAIEKLNDTMIRKQVIFVREDRVAKPPNGVNDQRDDNDLDFHRREHRSRGRDYDQRDNRGRGRGRDRDRDRDRDCEHQADTDDRESAGALDHDAPADSRRFDGVVEKWTGNGVVLLPKKPEEQGCDLAVPAEGSNGDVDSSMDRGILQAMEEEEVEAPRGRQKAR